MKDNEFFSDLLDSAWRFFAAVRLTIILLLSLAITSIIGTLIPQNENPADYVRAFGEFGYRFMDLLGLFDMYHSWWFQSLLLMLTINVVVCSLDRISTTWKVIFTRNPSLNISGFKRRKNKEEFTTNHAPEELKKVFEPLISKRFGYHRMDALGNGYYLYAEKRRWTRLGVYIVHMSVLLLLVGGLIGSIFGFEGFVNIAEGDTVDRIKIRNTNKWHMLGFEIRCDDFDVTFYDTGMPKEFRSSLTIMEQGQPVLQKDIIVNDPLRYKGINFFQSSYGQLPPQKKDIALPEEIPLSFKSKQTGMIYRETLKIGQAVDIPEGLGKFVIKEFRRSFSFRGKDLGETLIGTLTPADGNEVEVALPLRFPSFDRMSPIFNPSRKDTVFISVEDFKVPQQATVPKFYTGLQVTKDPGVWVVYIGFILMIIGFYITFFMSHQRIYVEITPRGNSSKITVVGTSNKNKLGMQQKVKKISDLLADSARLK
ncbi:MAG: cytochrome c biogenesis protein ResB [Desulfobacterales bacterium]|jgi:cytochrome c biogenesis protein